MLCVFLKGRSVWLGCSRIFFSFIFLFFYFIRRRFFVGGRRVSVCCCGGRTFKGRAGPSKAGRCFLLLCRGRIHGRHRGRCGITEASTGSAAVAAEAAVATTATKAATTAKSGKSLGCTSPECLSKGTTRCTLDEGTHGTRHAIRFSASAVIVHDRKFDRFSVLYINIS